MNNAASRKVARTPYNTTDIYTNIHISIEYNSFMID